MIHVLRTGNRRESAKAYTSAAQTHGSGRLRHGAVVEGCRAGGGRIAAPFAPRLLPAEAAAAAAKLVTQEECALGIRSLAGPSSLVTTLLCLLPKLPPDTVLPLMDGRAFDWLATSRGMPPGGAAAADASVPPVDTKPVMEVCSGGTATRSCISCSAPAMQGMCWQ